MIHSPVSAVLWDLDGTLADTHPLIHRCVNETFQEFFGRGYEQRLWEMSVGHPLTTVMEVGFREYSLTCDDPGALIRFYRARLASYESLVRPFPDAVDVVRALHGGGMRQAVVTTKFGEAADRHLVTLGLTDVFEFVVTGDQVSRHKPHPEPFCRALQLLDLPADQCVMVGDSAADILGARSAGVRTIAALWGNLDAEAVHAARPDHMAHRPQDVLAILGE